MAIIMAFFSFYSVTQCVVCPLCLLFIYTLIFKSTRLTLCALQKWFHEQSVRRTLCTQRIYACSLQVLFFQQKNYLFTLTPCTTTHSTTKGYKIWQWKFVINNFSFGLGLTFFLLDWHRHTSERNDRDKDRKSYCVSATQMLQFCCCCTFLEVLLFRTHIFFRYVTIRNWYHATHIVSFTVWHDFLFVVFFFFQKKKTFFRPRRFAGLCW